MEHQKNDGTRCAWGEECRVHKRSERKPLEAPLADAQPRTPPAEPRPELRDAFGRRDLRAIAWDLLEQLHREESFARNASPAATVMRVILALGEEPGAASAELEEMAVIGGVLNGIPPRDEAHWAIAERLFEPGTIAELRKWTPSRGWFGHPGEPDPFEQEEDAF